MGIYHQYVAYSKSIYQIPSLDSDICDLYRQINYLYMQTQ